MNTVEELIEMGLNKDNAEKAVESQERRIGESHGDFTIRDITYLGAKKKRVVLGCKYCGTEIVKVKDSLSGNHMKKMQRECECQKRLRSEAKKAETEYKRMVARTEAMEMREAEIKDRVGKEYGEHKIIGIDDGNYIAQCSICGANTTWSIAGFNARSDYLCHIHRWNKERFTESYIGMKNNYLTVIGITWDKISGRKRFRCRCDCGNITEIKPTFWETGQVLSCGCYLTNRSINAIPKERIKGIWRGMKDRCFNTSDKSYLNYGGRGITICQEWLDFEKFLKWSLENGYDNTKTIDRKDSNGNYDPENCRWITWDIQCRNKRPRKSKKYYEELKNGTSDR